MRKISLLDCTLRDGGYINDWRFGERAIRGFSEKIAQTGVEIFEVGFIKGNVFDADRPVFPDIESIGPIIRPKKKGMMYVGMLDMSAPVPKERLCPHDGSSLDGIRVIFKKEKIAQAFEYCKLVQQLGYTLFVQLVGTDLYDDTEFIEAIKLFASIKPYAISIVDSFGLIKRRSFLRYVYLADNNMPQEIVLGYHAHNNLQQAFGNAESLVEMNLNRDLCIDACVFGMGRGAGNLNLELFAEYMNESFGAHYRIEPMLEIMDEYLNDIYRTKFWGYSLPLYLSASMGCHPNYAIYLAEKDSLTVKCFNELLRSIPKDKKAAFSKDNAELYYREYMEKQIDDSGAIAALSQAVRGRRVLLLAPGSTLESCAPDIRAFIEKEHPLILAVNFYPEHLPTDYVFSSNMRRYVKLPEDARAKAIVTSNMKDDAETYRYMVNFSRYASDNPEIIDNSGLMALRLLVDLGVREVAVAGMDGYSSESRRYYVNNTWEHDFSAEATKRNDLISEQLKEIGKRIGIRFLTPSVYMQNR